MHVLLGPLDSAYDGGKLFTCTSKENVKGSALVSSAFNIVLQHEGMHDCNPVQLSESKECTAST